jgi:phosphoribosylanthranilate isomerase
MPVAVKICGITCVEDAELCVAEGADAIGLNFYADSKRYVGAETAREIVVAVGARVLTVGVFVDAGYDEIARIRDQTGIRCVQLHGHEPPELLARFLPHALKAVSVRDAESVAGTRAYGGEHILLDAYVPGQAGGTGATFRWQLATELARQRKVTLAGGLQPDNVAAAVTQVQPFCVDVASGVETSSSPRRKDAARVRAFIVAAKAAQAARA